MYLGYVFSVTLEYIVLHRFIVVLEPAEKLSGFLRTPLIRSGFSLTITLKLNSTRLKLQLTHGTFFFFEKKPSLVRCT